METDTNNTPTNTKCLNCGTEFQGKFCPECGQSADTGPYTPRFLVDNLIAAVLGRDGSIWFTIKSLFTRPGEMIVDNLKGKRKTYFSPFPLFFLVLALYLLITTLLNASVLNLMLEEHQPELPANATSPEMIKHEMNLFLDNMLRFYYGHYTLCNILTLPLAVIAARACYGKDNRKRYSWAEYTIVIVYSMVVVMLFRCLTKLLFPLNPEVISMISFLFSPLVAIVACTACFSKMLDFSVAKTTLRSILALLLYLLMLTALLLSIVIIFGIYLRVKYK